MTQADRTRTIKYVLAESSRWLLHRRRNTKKINIPGCRGKKKKGKKEKKNEKREVGSKVQKQARKSYSRRLHSNKISPSRLCSRDGDLATPSAIFFLLLSATVSSVTAAAVKPPSPRANQRKPNKTAWIRGL